METKYVKAADVLKSEGANRSRSNKLYYKASEANITSI